MHPDHMELRRYCDGTLSGTEADGVEEHVQDCKFCREFCDEYRVLSSSIDEPAAESLPDQVKDLADRIFRTALSGRMIPLSPFESGCSPEPSCLAADTGDKARRRVAGSQYFECVEAEAVRLIFDP